MVKKSTSRSLPEAVSLPEISPHGVNNAVVRATDHLLSQQHADGYWWYTLESNDTINAEAVLLEHYLGLQDGSRSSAICRWLIRNQREDGSWSLFFDGPGDISATVECYFALKICGYSMVSAPLKKAREFILANGGITKVRIFTRIHLALFGIVSWDICPKMPVSFIQLPSWAPVSIYEFSSWARASIVPLLVIIDQKKTFTSPVGLDELYLGVKDRADWSYSRCNLLSAENFFLQFDKALQIADRLGVKPLREASLKKCERHIREHLSVTEDIYPAMFYGILALVSLSYSLDDEHITKALRGLQSFQVTMSHNNEPLHAVPFHSPKAQWQSPPHINTTRLKTSLEAPLRADADTTPLLYQQCCLSPVWDTAWAGVALRDAGLPADHPALLKAARWTLSKQITDVAGDWAVKNPGVAPGGWAFEFENKFYPDVDDTIEVLAFLYAVDMPFRELSEPFERGVNWMVSMQSASGGFAAFDKDNELKLLNKLPFADHGACLDPPTADITGRMVEFLVTTCRYRATHPVIKRAADFTVKQQEKDGSFWGRWGVNYIYGTWGALGGLCALQRESDKPVIAKAIKWLKSVQNSDGGFGESCLSYQAGKYVALERSVPSQTAWALMTLIVAGEGSSPASHRAAAWLVNAQSADGSWIEPEFTGTGFPGHFFIRYHGYRHYFPLMALGRYSAR